jgi:hypothetical protein
MPVISLTWRRRRPTLALGVSHSGDTRNLPGGDVDKCAEGLPSDRLTASFRKVIRNLSYGTTKSKGLAFAHETVVQRPTFFMIGQALAALRCYVNLQSADTAHPGHHKRRVLKPSGFSDSLPQAKTLLKLGQRTVALSRWPNSAIFIWRKARHTRNLQRSRRIVAGSFTTLGPLLGFRPKVPAPAEQ